MEITLYSQELCPPCIALKEWFAQEKIPYRNIYTKHLDDAERKILRENILAVSKIDLPTVPAVQIVNGGDYPIWISNHGESDVTAMISQIKKVLAIK